MLQMQKGSEQFGHYFREGIILVRKLRSRGVKSSL
jgi:hypothetical protein